MADLRVKMPMKIVDPTTDANAAGVSAAGDLQVELGVAIPTGANVIGNVGLETGVNSIGTVGLDAGTNNVGDVDIVGGTLASDAPLTTNPVTMGGRASTATPTAVSADGDVVDLWLSREGAMQVDIQSGGGGPTDTDDDIVSGGQVVLVGIGMNYAWDGTQWERLNSDALGSLDVNVTLALPTGGNVIGNVGLEAGTNNIGDVDILTAPYSDGFGAASGEPAEAVLISGTDNTDTYGILVDAQGHLQIDVLTGGGATVPSGPTVEALIGAAVAAGGTGFLDTTEIVEAEKVYQISVAATVPYKFRIGFQENTVRNVQTGWMFGQAGTVSYFTPGHPDFYAHAGASGGVDTIYVEYFNMDNSETADIHATIEYAT